MDLEMSRESDTQDPHALELGHVYERLKQLETGQKSMQDTLHAVQLKLAEGPRFPSWLPVIMVSILLFLAGQVVIGLLWGGRINSDVASLRARLELCERCPVIEERVKHLEGRIVGNTSDGWHRRDQELYATGIEERFKRIEVLIEQKHK